MTSKPVSPFAGLDKALLRSTQTPHEDAQVDSTEPPPVSSDAVEMESAIAHLESVLKTVGKEIYYIRVTAEEKQRVDDLIYTFKRAGIRTSVNEIGRIALNSLLADYEVNGDDSVLKQFMLRKLA